MRKHKSNKCHYYERMINDEIAAGEFSADHHLIRVLKESHVTEDGKKALGIPENAHITMHDIHKQAVDSLPRMRFMYLLSLLEAFFQDYICERDGVDATQIKAHLRGETSKWSTNNNNDSTSFYHIPYALFLMNEKYGIDVVPNLQKATLEAGILRNCIVHHDGEVVNQYFLAGLREVASYQGNILSLNDQLIVDKKLMALFIEDFRRIIALLDYE